MEPNRQLRFLIPPFFLITSLLWGAYLSEVNLKNLLHEIKEWEKLIVILSATGIVVIATGFFIGVISVTILRIVSLFFRWDLRGRYDAPYSEEDVERVWPRLNIGTGIEPNIRLVLYAISTFQNTLKDQRVNEWLARRWNAFNVSAHSVCALLLAHVVALIIKIPYTSCWLLSTLIASTLLGINAYIAFIETRDMVVFQSYRENT